MGKTTCYTGLPVAKNPDGTMVPFFVQTRDVDIVMSPVVDLKAWADGSIDRRSLSSDCKVTKYGVNDQYVQMELNDTRSLCTWTIRVHSVGMIEAWCSDPILNFETNSALKNGYSGTALFHSLKFPLHTSDPKDQSDKLCLIDWNSVWAQASITQVRSQEIYNILNADIGVTDTFALTTPRKFMYGANASVAFDGTIWQSQLSTTPTISDNMVFAVTNPDSSFESLITTDSVAQKEFMTIKYQLYMRAGCDISEAAMEAFTN